MFNHNNVSKNIKKSHKMHCSKFYFEFTFNKNICHQYYHLKTFQIVMYSWSHDVIHPKGIIELNHLFHLEQINICSCLELFNNYEIMVFINCSTIEDINTSKFLKLTTIAYEMPSLVCSFYPMCTLFK
jgi:hypothetical protein